VERNMTNVAIVKLSSQRQVTLPARFAGALRLKPGDSLVLRLEGDRIVISPAPISYTDILFGSLEGRYGDVDQYLREERSAWQG
jgi:AbrB family looped-hinge helix DNA binding protein